MKAVRIHQFGGVEQLRYEDVATPVPRAGEVLVRTRAAGVNYADLMLRQDTYLFTPALPFVLGFDVAGTVEQLGAGVSAFQLGQRVLVSNRGGGYAEFVAAPAGQLVALPDGVPDGAATAVHVQGLTALGLLRDVQAGQRVLVHAAAGGVGSIAVQLAKLRGARVIGTASSAEKLAAITALGADAAINYTVPDWPEQVRAATDGAGADWILEMVGGEIGAQSLRCLALRGTMLVYGKASGQEFQLTPWNLVDQLQTVRGYNLRQESAAVKQAGTTELFGHLAARRLTIAVTEFPLSQAAAAQQAMASRRTAGKVVLLPEPKAT